MTSPTCQDTTTRAAWKGARVQVGSTLLPQPPGRTGGTQCRRASVVGASHGLWTTSQEDTFGSEGWKGQGIWGGDLFFSFLVKLIWFESEYIFPQRCITWRCRFIRPFRLAWDHMFPSNHPSCSCYWGRSLDYWKILTHFVDPLNHEILNWNHQLDVTCLRYLVGCILYWYQLNRSQDSTAPWWETYVRQIRDVHDVHLTGNWRRFFFKATYQTLFVGLHGELYVTSSRCKSPWMFPLGRFSTEVLKNPAWKPKGLGFHGHHMMSVTNTQNIGRYAIESLYQRSYQCQRCLCPFLFFKKSLVMFWTCSFAPQVRLAITVGEPSQRLVDVTYMPAYTP